MISLKACYWVNSSANGKLLEKMLHADLMHNQTRRTVVDTRYTGLRTWHPLLPTAVTHWCRRANHWIARSFSKGAAPIPYSDHFTWLKKMEKGKVVQKILKCGVFKARVRFVGIWWWLNQQFIEAIEIPMDRLSTLFDCDFWTSPILLRRHPARIECRKKWAITKIKLSSNESRMTECRNMIDVQSPEMLKFRIDAHEIDQVSVVVEALKIVLGHTYWWNSGICDTTSGSWNGPIVGQLLAIISSWFITFPSSQQI